MNNAGIGSSGKAPNPVSSYDDEFWDLTLRINLSVPYLLCKKLLPDMIKRGFGRIINIASIAGKHGLLYGAAYCASKHGLLGLTRTIAVEVIKDGVTANAICPGPVRTEANNERIRYDAVRLGVTPADMEAMCTPLGRRIEPQEVADLAAYLARNESSAITGQAYNIDAGLTCP